jgi:hypothetical protein
MNLHSLSRLARPVALLLLLASVLLLGANNAAWATPAQVLAGPTVPPREPRLELQDIKCKQQIVEVEFDVVRLRGDVTAFGAVTYVVNGATRTAGFDRRTGNTARYVDNIQPGDQNPDGVYNVTSATVTLIINGKDKRLDLRNPGTFTVHCQGPPIQPPQPGQPLPPQPGQLCAVGAPQGAVGPGINVTVVNCPWVVFVTGDDITINGMLEIRPVQLGAIPSANPGDILIGPIADIVLLDSNGGLIASPSFANPIEVCYFYGADELARAGNDPARFTIKFFDSASSAWVALPTAPTGSGRVCAPVTHLTRFALTARLPVPSTLPNTGAPEAPLLPQWIWVVIALIMMVGAALALEAVLLARK